MDDAAFLKASQEAARAEHERFCERMLAKHTYRKQCVAGQTPCLCWSGRMSPRVSKSKPGRPIMPGGGFSVARWAYQREHGVELPAELALRSLCRNRYCVEPSHHFPVPAP